MSRQNHTISSLVSFFPFAGQALRPLLLLSHCDIDRVLSELAGLL